MISAVAVIYYLKQVMALKKVRSCNLDRTCVNRGVFQGKLQKPVKKIKVIKKPRKRGRKAKGEKREPIKLKRLDLQSKQSLEDAISELPTVCDRGTKKNSKGYKTSWNGYKLHLDINDNGLPISALVTSASLHDSQVAIPLMKMTSSKVNYFYDLMDAAYDAKAINDMSKQLGHVPIIDRNGRGSIFRLLWDRKERMIFSATALAD